MHRHDNFRPWWIYQKPEPARRKAIFTAIAGYITSALVGLGLTAAVAGVAANLIIGAALLGISMLLAPRPPMMRTPQAQSVINQSIGPRIRGYGRALLGGTRAFFDSRNGLYQAIMMHSGEIDAVESIRIGDREVALSPAGEVITDGFQFEGVNAIRVLSYLGTSTQAADPMIMSGFPGIWTPAHQLKGIAYLSVFFRSPPQEDFQRIYPEGYNTPVRGLCRLVRVYDPRTDVTAWSDNASLAILDYLCHPDGFKKSHDDCDLQSFASFADLCDSLVAKSGGGAERRYRLSGVYQLTDDPEDVLGKMRAACDAELYQNAEGKIAIRGGQWQAPTVAITERDILGHSLEQGNDRFASFNELKITYTSPDHDFQSVEATPWVNLADQDERGVLPSELDLDFVPSPSQARRLAKIHIAKANPRWKGRIRTSLLGLNALGERTIRVILPELEIDEAFYVAGFSIDPELKYVDIEIMTISQAAYEWTPAEEGVNPAIPEDTSPDLDFPIPEDLTLFKFDSDTIRATVTPTPRTDLELQVQIRAGAGSLWQPMQTGSDNASAIYEPAAAGVYDARARWRGPQNVTGEWSFPYATIDTN